MKYIVNHVDKYECEVSFDTEKSARKYIKDCYDKICENKELYALDDFNYDKVTGTLYYCGFPYMYIVPSSSCLDIFDIL